MVSLLGNQARGPETGFWEVSVRCGCLWLMLRQGSLTTSLFLLTTSLG
jgi:hypothetical protein